MFNIPIKTWLIKKNNLKKKFNWLKLLQVSIYTNVQQGKYR